MSEPGDDAPPEVVAEVEAALETWAGEWLWTAEQLFDQWEDDSEGHTVLMPVMESDGDDLEEVSHGREDQ